MHEEPRRKCGVGPSKLKHRYPKVGKYLYLVGVLTFAREGVGRMAECRSGMVLKTNCLESRHANPSSLPAYMYSPGWAIEMVLDRQISGGAHQCNSDARCKVNGSTTPF
jgi:hypothetical protein